LKCYHFVSVPISSATLLSTPTDTNPVEVVSNRDQTYRMIIVLSEDLTTSCPSMLIAVQYNILPSSFMFPVYVSTLDDMILSTLQSVLQTSRCGEAYHFVSVPISSATLLSTPTDTNPVEVVSNRDQTFSCTTNAGRPSS
jgi:hypothetical protein